MTVPDLTRRSRLIVGGDDWVADLTDDTNGFTLSDTVTAPGTPATGIRWVEKDLTAYDRSLNVPTVYFGDATTVLGQRSQGLLIAAGSAEWDGGDAGWLGIPSTAPIDAQLTNNVNFIQRSPWVAGSTVVPFVFSAASQSVAVGSVTNTDTVLVAVTTKSVAGNRVLTLGDGSNQVTVSTGNPSVHRFDVSGLPNNTTAALSVASLSGDQTTTGLVVVGSVSSLPDERIV